MDGTAMEGPAREFEACIHDVKHEIHKTIVGQQDLVDRVLQCLFCQHHALLVGVPGLAKTLLVTTIARVIGLSFHRIQFTPDLMPSDITGADVLQDNPQTGRREFVFAQGPVFAHLVLADEVNRAPARTQAALLESMQERQVSVGTTIHSLPDPFMVVATQNPIEQEGTYRLPEAQLDRFMYMIRVDYPGFDDEIRILQQTTAGAGDEPGQVLDASAIRRFRAVIRQVIVRDDIYDYVLRLVLATRVGTDHCLPSCRQWLSWGAGPRAGQFLLLGAKAAALARGRTHVITDDVQAVAPSVLRHRLVTNYAAASEGVTADSIVDRVLDEVPLPALCAGR